MVEGLVLCQAVEIDEESLDEVPFCWIAEWLAVAGLQDIGEQLRNELAIATWGDETAPESD